MSERKGIVVRHLVAPGYEQGRSLILADERVTIQQFLDQQQWRFKLPTICVLNGQPLMRKDWSTTLIEVEDKLVFLSRPWGGGGGTVGSSKSSSIMGIVAMIALTAFAVWAGPFAAAAMGLTGALLTVGGAVITAGIVLGGSLLLSTLLHPSGAAGGTPITPLYQLAAGGNAAKPFAPIPVQYGRLKSFPDYAATPYSTYSGTNQFLNVLLCLGSGKFAVEQVLLNTTIIAAADPTLFGNPAPLVTIDGIRYYTIEGELAPGQTLSDKKILYADIGTETVPVEALNPAFVGITIKYYDPGQNIDLFPINFSQSDQVNGQELPDPTGVYSTDTHVGGFISNASGTLANAIICDFVFASGLYTQDSNGNLGPTPVTIIIEYQQVDDAGGAISPWVVASPDSSTAASTSITTDSIQGWTFNYATQQPQRFSIQINVSNGRYQVRASRTSTPAHYFVQPDSNGTTTIDTVNWIGLRSAILGPSSFPDVAIIAIQMLATDQLTTASSKQFAVIATRILPAVWNAFADELQELPTQSPAWAFYDAATNTSYGAGRPPASIDFAGLVDLDAGCQSRGDACNILFNATKTVPQAFDDILISCRTKHKWIGSNLTFVRDELVPIPQMSLDDRQIVRSSLTIDYIFNTDITSDSVIIEYLDEGQWLPADVQYPANGSIPGFVSVLPARIKVASITNRAQAYREAAFYYLQAFYRRIKVTLETEHDGRLLSLGSVIQVQTELPQSWGTSGYVSVATFNGLDWLLTLDPAPTWPLAGLTFLNLRARDGSYFGPVNCTQGISPNIAILNPTDLATVESQTDLVLTTDVLDRQPGAEPPSFDFGTATSYSRKCIVLSGEPRGDNVSLSLVVENDLVHTTDLADPPPIPPSSPLLNPAVPQISGLVANFTQGVTEPLLSATWNPSPGASSYNAQVSYDGGNSWVPIYSGSYPGLQVVVSNASLILRVQAIATGLGPWTNINVTVPPIVLTTPIVGLTALISGLSKNVEDALNQTALAIAAFQQQIAAIASEADAGAYIGTLTTTILASETLGNMSAKVSETIGAIITSNEAIATLSTSVTAEIGALTTSVTETSTVVAAVDGKLLSTWQLTLDSNGFVSGIQAFNDGSTSDITIDVSTFQVAFPGVAGGAPIPVFQIANVGGVAQIAFQGDMLADGAITSRTINVGAINASSLIANNVIVTGHLQADTATSIAYVTGANTSRTSSTGSHTYTDVVCTLNYSPFVGNVLIDASCDFFSTAINGKSGTSTQMQLLIDGVVVRSTIIIPYLSQTDPNVASGAFDLWGQYASTQAIPHFVNLTAGVNHLFQIRISFSTDTGQVLQYNNSQIRIIESLR